ncbi:collagen alpha-1(I) chain-like [Amphibalanus amphitrite]|uniref:collagen alpha-1(I) chain-like n=1 Tax=Amphibalanus amphitrite TaxID=1232801 RepID=UPI001C918EE5|nr:collagen alpha-1(I) chain-like [Amphibalanus amphitrite]
MTSQVKAALGRVRPKADDTGIQHQLSRTRALVDSFREQLARRTVTLGRLVPPDTTGRPEIPRELRTKDPAGGDVSPPTPQPAARAVDGGPRATQEAISSLQALVTGAAAADPPAATTCRWSSRVKRRFLAARRPARRVGERLKAPHTANARWQGPAAAGGGPSSSRPSSPPSPGRSSGEEEEEEDGRPTDYLTPGCYDLDGAGRPVCAGDPAAAGGGPGAAAGLFGVPLSVMMAEAAKKKKRQPNSGCQGGPAGGPRSAGAGAGAGAGAEPGRKDRSWLTTAAAPAAPAQAPRVPQVPVPRAGPQPGLAETLDSLRRLAVGVDQRPAAAGLGSGPRSSERARSCSGGPEPADSSPRGPDGAGSSPRSSERIRSCSGGPDGADSSPRGTDEADSDLSGTPRDGDGPAEDWMTSSFDEDWFLSTEREEREEEEARRRAEEEEEEARRRAEEEEEEARRRAEQEEDQRRRRGGGAEAEESQTRREARRLESESESESELNGQTSALRVTPESQ